jgi:hypothetical protein
MKAIVVRPMDMPSTYVSWNHPSGAFFNEKMSNMVGSIIDVKPNRDSTFCGYTWIMKEPPHFCFRPEWLRLKEDVMPTKYYALDNGLYNLYDTIKALGAKDGDRILIFELVGKGTIKTNVDLVIDTPVLATKKGGKK